MNQFAGPIRVLHVDDEPDFAEMAATFLERQNPRFEVETATNVTDGLEQLAAGEFDCIVSDYDMPGQNGIDFLKTVREEYPNLPFILYTGRGSEEVASDAISAGVTDYLEKRGGTSQYTVLANRISNAVENYYAQSELTNRENRLSLFFEQSPLGVIEWNEDFTVARANEAAEEILGYSDGELSGRSWASIVHDSEQAEVSETFSKLIEDEGGFHSKNTNIRKDGSQITCEWYNRVVTNDAEDVIAIFSQFQDITNRETRERQLDALHEVAMDLSGLHSVSDIADRTVQASEEILSFDISVIDIEEDGILMKAASSEEIPEENVKKKNVC